LKTPTPELPDFKTGVNNFNAGINNFNAGVTVPNAGLSEPGLMVPLCLRVFV
jgi:hypothetical protein